MTEGIQHRTEGGANDKQLPANVGDTRVVGSILGSGGSPGEWNGTPHQYSCQENSMGRGASHATVHGATKSRTRLSKLIYFYYFF